MTIRFPHALAVLVATLSLLAASASPARAVELVRDGKPAAVIVLPERTEYDREVERRLAAAEAEFRKANPGLDAKALEEHRAGARAGIEAQLESVGDEEELAAEELRAILEKISSARLPIERVAEGRPLPDGPAIVLGAALARGAGLGEAVDGLDKDGLLCRARGQTLFLTGRRARGTLYAAYEFLESLGCRWVMPGEFGELYPTRRTLATKIDKASNPSHSQRYWWCTYGEAPGYARWTLRNKGNFVKAIGDPVVTQGHYLGQPLVWGAQQPEFQVKVKRLVKEPRKGPDGQPVKDAQGNAVMEEVEREVNELPAEYYAQVHGKPSHANPNFANPKAWDLYAKHYIEGFNKHPNQVYASISAEDGMVIDENPASVRLRSNEVDPTMGQPSATDQLWYFHNRVIERVTAVHPDRKFSVLVYANNMMPPRLEPVHPSMALVFAPLGICPLHHVRDESCRSNRFYRGWLEDWMALARSAGAESYYYDYEPMGYCWNMAMICPRWGTIGKNYPWFAELGLTGHTTQGYDDWASSGLNNYLMQRLYWDATRDYKAIIADYAEARFGAAGPAMIAYFDLLEKRMGEIPDLYSNEVWANHLILTPRVRAEARKLLRRAAKKADTERARVHVQTMLDLQASTDAACDAVEIADATGDFGEAAEAMAPIWATRDKLNRLYPNYMNSTRLDEKQTAQFMTGGIYQQYLKFDRRIDAAKASVLLPRDWKGGLDTGNRAQAAGLHKPGADVSGLDTLDVTICPDVKYQTQNRVAAFFYRTEADVPASFAGAKASLYFPSVIAKALQIWVNGEPVKFEQDGRTDTTWRGPDYFWIDYDHEESFDITPHLKPGRRNTIAFRVFKSYDFGGTYRRVYLLAE